MQTIWCALLGLIAGLFALIGTAVPFRVQVQAADDRAYYDHFKVTAAGIDENGPLPSVEVLVKMERAPREPLILSSLTKPSDCDSSFKPAPEDRFVLSFWRGEWKECYAHPSGRSTLLMSFQDNLRGFGPSLLIYWLIAATAAWGAIRLRSRRRA